MPITTTPDGRNTWISWDKVVSLCIENAICRYVDMDFSSASLNLREKPGMDLDMIESIICKTHSILPIFASRHQPQNGYEAKFSLEYCIATALLSGKVLLEDYTDKKVKDSQRRAPRTHLYIPLAGA